MTDTVYVVGQSNGGGRETYHTDPDCRALAGTTVHERTAATLPDTMDCCAWCAGESQPTAGAGNRDHYQALVEAGGGAE